MMTGSMRNRVVRGVSAAALAIGMIGAPAFAQSVSVQEGGSNAGDNESAEIVVTAQKRGDERLLEVPVPISVVSAETLVSSNTLSLKDYYTRIPGLNLRQAGNISGQVLSIRGISTGSGNPTVGIMIDDVPFGGSTLNGGGLQVPDFDPGELSRIEVLRGPQGTLYGASSMGGLIRFVSAEPSTTEVSGRIQAGLSGVHNGDEPSYNIRGSANLPLSDKAAIRASGFFRRDPGYIDNIRSGERAVNSADVYGGRLSALFHPSADLTIKLGALLQESDGDGLPYAGVSLPDLTQDFIPGVGGYVRRSHAYSGQIEYDAGPVRITSLTGYGINYYRLSYDYTPFLGGAAQAIFGVSGAQHFQFSDTTKFSQELRLDGDVGDRLEWLIGGFYTHEKTLLGFDDVAASPTTGQAAGLLQRASIPTTFKEYAVFGNLTVKLSNRFDVQLGARESKNRQTIRQTATGPSAGLSIPLTRAEGSAFTYLITPRFRISPDFMVYGRVATGYRAGAPNTFAGGIPPAGASGSYDPDRTTNYELGAKGSLFDGSLNFDLSIFHIDWKDIQLLIFQPSCACNFTTNGGAAVSEGVELSLTARPTGGMTISAAGSLNRAELSEDLPLTSTVRGFEGDRLPYSSKFSGTVSIDQEVPLSDFTRLVLGGTLSYVGDRLSLFQGPSMTAPGPSRPRQRYPAYTKIDLRAGLRLDRFDIDIFVANVTDERGAVAGGIGDAFPTSLNYIQPRTVGASVSLRF